MAGRNVGSSRIMLHHLRLKLTQSTSQRSELSTQRPTRAIFITVATLLLGDSGALRPQLAVIQRESPRESWTPSARSTSRHARTPINAIPQHLPETCAAHAPPILYSAWMATLRGASITMFPSSSHQVSMRHPTNSHWHLSSKTMPS